MEQFRLKARLMLGSVLPGLSERVHRAVTPADEDPPSSLPSTVYSAPLGISISNTSPYERQLLPEDWTFPAAQARLTQAFADGGIGGWAEQVEREMEAEKLWELQRRGRREANGKEES